MSYSLIGLHGTKADFKGTQSGLNEEKYQTILKEKHGHVRNDKKKNTTTGLSMFTRESLLWVMFRNVSL